MNKTLTINQHITLLPEDVARIFAMYPNAKIYDDIAQKYISREEVFLNWNYLMKDFKVFDNWNEPILSKKKKVLKTETERFWYNKLLLLRQLEDMSEKMILELCKIVDEQAFGHYRFSKWKITRSEKWERTWKCYEVRNEKSEEWFQIDLIDGQVDVYLTDGTEHTRTTLHNIHYWQWYLINNIAIKIYPWDLTPVEMKFAMFEVDDKIEL